MQHFSAERFVKSPSPPLLAGDDIHLWLLVLDPALKPREVTMAAHSLLGKLLAQYANLPEAPEIARTDRGKPYAPALAGIDFNLSHARDHVLIAIARNQPLGVDLERVDRRIEIVDLARRYFARAEADALEALPETARPAAFLRLWTCKEAVLKAIGEGLSFGLDRVAFTLGAGGIPIGPVALATEAGPPHEWRVALLEPADGFLGALAWRGPARHVRTFLAPADA
ncbi:MAG TPA: 4'-phosphopantetheinyl transferase superfamily protein [Rhodanobacteraceae bacterium]|jgi:4'-phosphopantetheinyl transferase|nr:4'-phosphopantetheinyl transferase superfamily protein [Rhodanobacteraceae bacterium]